MNTEFDQILKKKGFREYKIIKNDGEVFRAWSIADLRTWQTGWRLVEETEKEEAIKNKIAI